ncbi:hypothetical protein NE237_020611 [Protea cynaroides]|uniref:Uncharacterized protein n=1 Tax=Protea cynaroides TaxID=273540 RepID=A0A9Q0H8R1_9MAGN|nr:hypothetical protein NE237_020611 [Protea cynaroides]
MRPLMSFFEEVDRQCIFLISYDSLKRLGSPPSFCEREEGEERTLHLVLVKEPMKTMNRMELDVHYHGLILFIICTDLHCSNDRTSGELYLYCVVTESINERKKCSTV